jgi:hypothetical protein
MSLHRLLDCFLSQNPHFLDFQSPAIFADNYSRLQLLRDHRCDRRRRRSAATLRIPRLALFKTTLHGWPFIPDLRDFVPLHIVSLLSSARSRMPVLGSKILRPRETMVAKWTKGVRSNNYEQAPSNSALHPVCAWHLGCSSARCESNFHTVELYSMLRIVGARTGLLVYRVRSRSRAGFSPRRSLLWFPVFLLNKHRGPGVRLPKRHQKKV